MNQRFAEGTRDPATIGEHSPDSGRCHRVEAEILKFVKAIKVISGRHGERIQPYWL